MRGVPSEIPSPMNVEGHEMSANKREEMDRHEDMAVVNLDEPATAANEEYHKGGWEV